MPEALRVPVSDLRRHLGTRRDVTRRISAADVRDMGGVAGTVVPADGEMVLDVALESVPEGVMASGTVIAPWNADCRRCLDRVAGEIVIEVRELFEHAPTPGDTYPLDDDTVDLEPMLRDAVLLALPLSVVCRDDCPGPDPERFPAVTDAGSLPPSDPRWAALGELRFDE